MRNLLAIGARVAAAVFGGYALAHTLPIAVSAALPVDRADATLTAIQTSFLVFTAAVLWAFAARSAFAAWMGLLAPAVLAGLAAWWLA